MSTSWSDTENYKEACRDALTKHGFKNFKRNSNYNIVLEHVNEELGQAYLNKILQDGNFGTVNIYNACLQNDIIGNPVLYNYSGLSGPVSPTSLRYVKVLSDFKNLFGDLTDKYIVEIGGGYGGQFIINNKFYDNTWIIFDIPEAADLQIKYIKELRPTAKFFSYNHIIKIIPDLLISNYAFSEINRNVQEEYYEKVIKNAKSGYMIFNNDESHDNMTIEELNGKISGSKIIDNSPDLNTLVWGTD